MSQVQLFGSGGNTPVANIETLSGEGGTQTGPLADNFNFSGSVSGGAAVNGAILFNIPSMGEMDAVVQVDGTTIVINASNQLEVVGQLAGTVTTAGLQTLTVLTIPTSNNSVTTFQARISGYATPIIPGVSAGLGGTLTAAFITGSVNTTAIDTPDAFIQTFVSSTATFTATNSGTNIIITVTGDAAYDIDWKCQANVTEVS